MDPSNAASHLVEPNRVHRRVYSDPDIFDLEVDRIFGQAWVYVGHDSQVPKPGDYITTKLGRQPVIMARHADGVVRVFHNRCPHHGSMICGDRAGNTGRTFTCMYHGWVFGTDGALLSVPLPEDYDGTPFDCKNGANGLKAIARVRNYRGFVFASLAAEGPSFEAFSGGTIEGIDNMLDRAPEGEVEVAGDCFRIIQQSNWKIFLENMYDNVHPGYVHGASARGARKAMNEFGEQAKNPMSLEILGMLNMDDRFWKSIQLDCFPYGHVLMSGFVSPRRQDAETLAYEASLVARHGQAGMERILSRNIHHAVLYPSFVLQPSFQQLRIVRPISVDRTMLEIYLFRLKGAPKSFFKRALSYSIVANSPANLVSADDLESYWRVQNGLTAPGSDWVLLHRDFGRDRDEAGVTRSRIGTSEIGQRNNFQAWREYMSA